MILARILSRFLQLLPPITIVQFGLVRSQQFLLRRQTVCRMPGELPLAGFRRRILSHLEVLHSHLEVLPRHLGSDL